MRVGVLYGGTSPERPGSLVSGEAAAKALLNSGPNVDVVLLDVADVDFRLVDHIDVAFLAVAGPGGEDGSLQGCLETMGIPYTGSGVRASAICMHKPSFKGVISAAGVNTPEWLVADGTAPDEVAKKVGNQLGFPAFLKPAVGGGSLGMAIAEDEEHLVELLTARGEEDPYREFFMEELIEGASCSVGVLDVDGETTTLPVYQVATDREFYDHTAKKNPSQRAEWCPANLPGYIRAEMQRVALAVHRLIGAHGVSRVDMMVTASERIAVLEVNTLPGLSKAGNLAVMAKAANIEYPDLVRHILATAFTRRDGE